jgi:hypothetical protein
LNYNQVIAPGRDDLWKREKADDPRVQRITSNLLRRMIRAKL